MLPAAAKVWTEEEFFAWQEKQEDRCELVDGRPLRMMAGASKTHDRIVVNLLASLHGQLRGTPCRPFTGDGSVRTEPGRIRRPDVGVDCDPSGRDGYVSEQPRLIVEVFSPSTRDFDTYDRLREYKRIEGLHRILLVEPNRAEVTIWTSGAEAGWTKDEVAGLGSSVHMPELGIVLVLADVYDGIAFPADLRIVGSRL